MLFAERITGKILVSIFLLTACFVHGEEISGHGGDYYAQKTQAHIYTNAVGQTMPYRLFVPSGCNSGKNYPLVFKLHGAGARGNDNVNQLRAWVAGWVDEELQKKHPCIILMPQCPKGKKWVDQPWKNGSYSIDDTPMSEPMSLAKEIFDEVCGKYPVDTDRIYVAGESMGGYGTWYFVARFPELVAAAVPVCGAGSPETADRLKDIPIWAFHGDQDTTVPTSGSIDMVEAIRKAGGKEVKLTIYPGVAHSSFKLAWKEPELIEWLFSQKK